MSGISVNKKWVFPIHLLFWSVFVTLSAFLYGNIIDSGKTIAIIVITNLFGQLLLVYGNLLYLIPRYYSKGRYLKYAILLITLLLLTTLMRFYVGQETITNFKWGEIGIFTPSFFGGLILSSVFLLAMSIPLMFIDNYFRNVELEVLIRTQQLESELRFLKAQVNPHFLFNALNNIYSLSFTKSEQTPEMILKLSEMMSYMLYDCKAAKVKLSSEIGYLENYIALQQLKKDGEQKITFSCSQVKDVNITPMLFIPFFENAFKHGNIEDVKNGWINSSLSFEGDVLTFKIENSISLNSVQQEQGGIGLVNVRERLQLLYPQKHELNIEKENGVFKVDLSIDLL